MNLKEKYEKIKERFFKYYISIGDFNIKGMNIPASQRSFQDPDHDWMNFGDAEFNIGQYLQYLTSEFLVLEKIGKDTNETLYKLYQCLKSFERLDKTAFRYYTYYGTEDELDGYFIRSDVDENYLKYNKNLNKFRKNNKTGITSELILSKNLNGDLLPGLTTNSKEESQDQVWGILPGFAMVIKMFENKKYKFKYNNIDYSFNFKKFTQETLHRVIKHIAKNKWIIRNSYGEVVQRGGKVSFNAYAFAKCCDFLCEDSGLESIVKNYTNLFHKISYYTVFGLSKFLYYKLRPMFKFLQKKIPVKDYSFSVFSAVGNLGINTNKFLTNQTLKRDNFSHLPLIYSLIHNKNIKIDKSFYEEFLNQSEIQNYDFKNIWWNELRPDDERRNGCSHERWRAKDNCWRSDFRDKNNGNIYSTGLDYMLLYNLYLLIY